MMICDLLLCVSLLACQTVQTSEIMPPTQKPLEQIQVEGFLQIEDIKRVEISLNPHLRYMLKGPLIPEILNMEGAKIRLTGTLEARSELTVISYEVLSPSPEIQSLVGILWVKDNQIWLKNDQGQDIELFGPLVETLATFMNAKVWVTGRFSENQRFNVLGFRMILAANETP